MCAVSKNESDIEDCSFNAHQEILCNFWQKCCCDSMLSVIPPLLTNVSTLPGETQT